MTQLLAKTEGRGKQYSVWSSDRCKFNFKQQPTIHVVQLYFRSAEIEQISISCIEAVVLFLCKTDRPVTSKLLDQLN